MKISKRARDQAARICQMMALSPPCGCYDAEETLGLERFGSRLARDAFHSAWKKPWCRTWNQYWAEAEAMLRTGWTP